MSCLLLDARGKFYDSCNTGLTITSCVRSLFSADQGRIATGPQAPSTGGDPVGIPGSGPPPHFLLVWGPTACGPPHFFCFFSFIFLAYNVYCHSISRCLLMKQTPRKILSLNSCRTIGYFLALPHIAYTRLKLPDFAEP
jgi:hypothetical protein